jgi:hypothetical protein
VKGNKTSSLLSVRKVEGQSKCPSVGEMDECMTMKSPKAVKVNASGTYLSM